MNDHDQVIQELKQIHIIKEKISVAYEKEIKEKNYIKKNYDNLKLEMTNLQTDNIKLLDYNKNLKNSQDLLNSKLKKQKEQNNLNLNSMIIKLKN